MSNMDMDRLVKAIVHYQQNLEKYIVRRNEAKMIYCMEKLQKLPITVSHLEHTGVGRTVNSVRKMKGIKGSPKNTAKQLVAQWKKMVTEEELNESGDEEESAHENDNDDEQDEDDSEDRLQIYCENEESEVKEENHKQDETRNIEMQHSSHYDDEHDAGKFEKYRDKYDEGKYCDNDRIGFEHLGVDRVEARETRIVKHRSPNCNDEDDYSDFYSNSVLEANESKSTGEDGNDEVDEEVEDQQPKSEKKDDRSSKHRKHKRLSQEGSAERSGSKDKEKHKHKEREKENHHENGHHQKSSSNSSSNNSKEKEKSDKQSTHRSSKSSRSNSSKEMDSENKEKENRKRDKEKEKEKSKSQPGESSKKRSTSSSSSSSSSKKRTQEESTKSTPAKKLRLSIQDGIDCESGASFAEALGMMMPGTSKVKKEKDRKEGSKVAKEREKERKEKHAKEPKDDKERERERSRGRDRTRDHQRDRDKERKPEKKDGSSSSKTSTLPAALQTPPLLSTKSVPTDDLGISTFLPQISTNYKPVGFLPGEGQRVGPLKPNDDEMLSKLMYAKNQRTKVYSGNKVFYGVVPTLFDYCIRLLQDNLDTLALGYTGGVPYSILKPVLDRATPSQLFSLEHYNTYLMDDSDELWRLHCQREFKAKQRNEMETWREMYLRSIDERDAKLKSLTANIKLAQDKSVPVRQTKLAYVDTIAKAPRAIAKKQAKNGIPSSRPMVTPSSRLQQLAMAGGADKIAVPNPGAHRANAGGGGGSSGGSNYPVKPKKAPLMAKTLQLMKGRFRR